MSPRIRCLSKPLPFLAAMMVLAAGPVRATEPAAVRINPRFQPCGDAACRPVPIAPLPTECAPGECGPDDAGAYDVATLPTAAVIPLYGSSTAVAQQLASISRTEVAARERVEWVRDSEKTLRALVKAAQSWRSQQVGEQLVARMEASPDVMKGESKPYEVPLQVRAGRLKAVGTPGGLEIRPLDIQSWMGEPVIAHTAMHAGFITGSLPVLVNADTGQLELAVISGIRSLYAAAGQGLAPRLKEDASNALSRASQRQHDDGLIEKIFMQGHEGLGGDRSLVHASFSLGLWTALALDSGGIPPAGFSALGRNLALMLEKNESLREARWMAPAVRGIAAELDRGASRSQRVIHTHARSLLITGSRAKQLLRPSAVSHVP